MQEGVALIAHIHKACVQARHQFPDLCQVDVSHDERGFAPFFLKLHEPFVFQQCDGDFLGLNVYYNFACHSFVFTV